MGPISVMAGLVPAIHVLALENDSALTPFIPAPAYAGAGSSGKPEATNLYICPLGPRFRGDERTMALNRNSSWPARAGHPRLGFG